MGHQVNMTSIAEEAKRKRWKYIGYSGASRWMASDSDFFVIRRFDTLNTRLILERQAQIASIEQKLARIDESIFTIDQDNSTVLDDGHPERPELLRKLWPLMKEYSTFLGPQHRQKRTDIIKDEFVSVYSDLKARPPALGHETKNVRNWLRTYKGAICEEEASFVEREDLMPIITKNKTPLRRLLEHWGAFCKTWLFRASKKIVFRCNPARIRPSSTTRITRTMR